MDAGGQFPHTMADDLVEKMVKVLEGHAKGCANSKLQRLLGCASADLAVAANKLIESVRARRTTP